MGRRWEQCSRGRCGLVWSGIVTRDALSLLTKLAAGVALHGLGLAVAGKVVGSTALVAGGRASAASETATETSSVTATRSTSAATHSRVGTVAGKVAGDTAAVATSAGAGSAQAQSWAVSLDVSETLAVIALLGCFSVSPSFSGCIAASVLDMRQDSG